MTDFADHPTRTLRMTRHFNAPPVAVFALWSRPELVSRWWASSHVFRLTNCEMELRVGGAWRLTTVKGDTVEHPHGAYHRIEMNRAMTMSYAYPDTDFHTVLSIELTPEQDGTRLDLLQTGFPDDRSCDDHKGGWSAVMHMMSEALAAAHGLGAYLPSLSQEQVDGVARDFEAARARHEEEMQKRRQEGGKLLPQAGRTAHT